ncbi:PLP-dependent cysteine synthase family protein [Aeromicrobium sp.]|uniref:PLP-dependent cysteine synthase family protein n=1 Tax=Aeromicrobium sp. TaxID=1871063 RepID=UPI001993694A|nr:PLP-dependent cysteine synthase family protein [Aeromicrobium sp.]MBC7631862.1 PLP-dependent cysteine synthase family protein [Aeromicrobium sp.]
MPKTSTEDRAWIAEAIRRVDADANRSADTHLHVVPIPVPGIELYLKDESVHPTGSLKHRLARSLFLYALCNGWIGPGATVIEASSGSTAVSEAYFARLIELPFVAVMPSTTSCEKIALIEFYGGTCHLVDDPGTVYKEAQRLAHECGGHYMDQFTYAERATDWRGNNNIAESIYEQMQLEPHPCPAWIVVGAGTGGTSATIGRYVRYRRLDTRVAVADPENSAFYAGWESDRSDVTTDKPSRIEGIGRMRIEGSFVGGVIDDMVLVPDAASIAAARWISHILGRPVGGSTGTNIWASLRLIGEMQSAGEEGSLVTLLCDGGERYLHTYYDDSWLEAMGLDIAPYAAALEEFARTGSLPVVS